jgi:SAM-dependent methyltransferase
VIATSLRSDDRSDDVISRDPRTQRSIDAYGPVAREYREQVRLRRPVADMRRFAGFARRDDLVLDVGCGPANDLRGLRDVGLHPVGIDLSFAALVEARTLLPRHPLIQAGFEDPPFTDRSFGGLWMSGAFAHLPRDHWRDVLARLLRLIASGPVYFTCHRGTADLQPFNDPLLGEINVSAATEDEVTTMLRSLGVVDLTVDVRPDLRLDRRVPWVVALGRVKG